jgi:type VI secretion system FHA domain protein
MSLALSAIRHAGEQFVNAITTPLTAARCKIGRGHECDIVLEDPTRRVSRVHATVNRQGGSYVLTVDSRVNPVVVNENTLTAGQSAVLSVGDEIAIGDYVFTVVDVGGAGESVPGAATDLYGASPNGGGAGRSDLEALLDASTVRIDSLQPGRSAIDDLIGGHSQRAEDPLLGILGGGPAGTPSQANEPAVPEFHDPLMQLLGDSAGSGPGSNASAVAPVFAGHMVGGVTSIDHLLGSGSSSGADPLGIGVPDYQTTRPGFGGGRGGSLELDHVHDVNLPFSPPEARQAPVRAAPPPAGLAPAGKDDPLAAILGESKHSQRAAGTAGDPLGLFDEPSPGRASAANAAFDGSLQDATYVLHPQAPDAAARETGPSPAAAGISMAQAVQAFLQGAAMEGVQVSDEEAEAFLRECGAVCRAAIEGLMGLLLARATVKDQLRVSDRTMVAARENNALKLIENVDEAVKFVFDRSSRTGAFLPPDQAVADACTDLQVHEIALVAGMRSALTGAIKRFNPSVIEKKLDKGGGSSLLANKKAKLWDTFLVYYEDTTRDAEDNFDRVFGPDFLRAYQEQLKRLKS